MQKGQRMSQQQKDKIGQSNKGKPSHWLGKKHTEETKKKLSAIHTGKKMSLEAREKMRQAKLKNPTRYWLGKKLNSEVIERLRQSHIGQSAWNKGIKGCFSEESKKKISDTCKRKGIRPPVYKGMVFSDEHKRKLSVAAKKQFENIENHPAWRGGISFEPYTTDWTKTLKISIRERDKYTCQICGDKQGDMALHVHHIDYNKKNCNPTNLVALCRRCHLKTNHNREYWKNRLETRYE